MAYLREALEGLRADNPTNRTTGNRFEHLVLDAFRLHPGEYGRERFRHVWLFSEWPERQQHGYQAQDLGIDLVAEQTPYYGGGYVAIQVKAGQRVSTSEIDSFLAESNNEDVFKGRLLVAGGKIDKHGLTKMSRATPPVEVLSVSQMDDWVDDWRPIAEGVMGLTDVTLLKHTPRSYQVEALRGIAKGFAEADRGKLIMPCGTGKSVVALWAAEQEAGAGATVLYLVPSLALMGQTMREWSRHRTGPIQYIGVCSDPSTAKQAGEVRTAGDLAELAMPVTTDAKRLAEQLAHPIPGRAMRVVFATYQSSPTVAEAVAKLNKGLSPDDDRRFYFKLIVCDEAHRTTAISLADVAPKKASRNRFGISPFQLVHHNKHLPAMKRLFMTATPRVFTEKVRATGVGAEDDCYSMDDPEVYGEEFFRMTFAEALDLECLSDYRVLVIVASEASFIGACRGDVDAVLNQEINGAHLDLRSAALLAGCWDALASPETTRVGDLGLLPGQVDAARGGTPAQSAIAFLNSVRASEQVTAFWSPVAEYLSRSADSEGDPTFLKMHVEHMDGTTPAAQRAEQLRSLRAHAADTADTDEPLCRVLTNAQVLTEGVDVPALDAVLFLEPRSSEVNITQAVGRVMRKAPNKQHGLIVIPVVIPEFGAGTREERAQRALTDGDFTAVWQVVRALRSHDERVNYWVSNPATATESPIDITIFVDGKEPGNEQADAGEPARDDGVTIVSQQLALALADGFASLMVERVGDRHLYPNWGRRAAQVCASVQMRVDLATAPDSQARPAFEVLLKELRESVSPDITDQQAAQMIAQHVVTIPVFEEMFAGSRFKDRNPVSVSITKVVDALRGVGYNFDEDLHPLRRAYSTMKDAFHGANDGAMRLDTLRQIYDGFFNAAMEDEVKRLGIAYTPVEFVDFMLRSVDAVCRQHFGRGLTDENVNILDPFTGTGTFINRLLTLMDATGNYLVRDTDLLRKVRGEIHANELVLLAYYIAALKIEEAIFERLDEQTYEPFPGIVLTDTFLMNPRQKQLGGDGNTARKRRQEVTPIHVIISNPPWSSGQDSAGDDNQNRKYDAVAEEIKKTYVAAHKELTKRAPGGNASGNLFVKAFRWATDRLVLPEAHDGPAIIAYIHPNSLIGGTSLAGMRMTLRKEFTEIYVINLRGDAYKSGEEFKREGDKLFGGASRNGVQITILVRDPRGGGSDYAAVRYAEVQEYASLEEKLGWLADMGDATLAELTEVPVNDRHDWADLGDPTFTDLVPLADAKSGRTQDVAVTHHASGIKTNGDTYLYSFSYVDLVKKVRRLIKAFNGTLAEYRISPSEAVLAELTSNTNLASIKWTDTLKQALRRQEKLTLDRSRIREVLYRPFTKLWLYEDYRIASAGSTVSGFFPRPGDSVGSGALDHEAHAGGGYPQFSSTRHDRSTSVSSTAGPPSRTSASRDDRLGPIHSANRPDRSVGPDGVRCAGGVSADGPPRAGAGDSSEGLAEGALADAGGGVPAILVNQTQQIEFGALSSHRVSDLHITGRETRIYPYRRC